MIETANVVLLVYFSDILVETLVQDYEDEKVVASNNVKSKAKLLEHFENYYNASTYCEVSRDNEIFLEHNNINRSYLELVDAK